MAGFAFSPFTASVNPEITTAIAHLRDVLGNRIYESLARQGETMTKAEIVTYTNSAARRRPRPTLVRQPGPRAHSQRDPRRMRHRPKASDHLRMPAAVARRLRTRLVSLSDRPPALHQNHRTMDPVLARPQPQIPPIPTTRPQPPSPRPTRLPR
jgi:hypothetical protein